jgi:hypothetical protein
MLPLFVGGAVFVALAISLNYFAGNGAYLFA